MSFMPAFNQSVMELSRERQLRTEAKLLARRSRDGLSRVLGSIDMVLPEAFYQQRLEDELRIIEAGHYCSYFLIVADYVSWAKVNDIAVGPGRGSGPCSLVGFALGITSVDPITYNLPFERFVNPLRDTLPDFDLDFCDERCSEVTEYIRRTYGEDRVARLSNENQLPLDARLIIADRPLTELVPINASDESAVTTAKTTMCQSDIAGLVRFNVINQKALTLHQQLARELAASGEIVDVANMPLDDEHVYRMLSDGEVSHISALDGENYKATLMAVKPERFSDLYAVIALCYPKLQSTLLRFIEHKKNPALLSGSHPIVKRIAAETYGLILFQEQVMHIAHAMAGMSFAEGDLFRRALQRGNHEAVEYYGNIFCEGAVRFGLAAREAESLLTQVVTDGRNTFNKSHAVAFAMLAYQTVWLKSKLA